MCEGTNENFQNSYQVILSVKQNLAPVSPELAISGNFEPYATFVF
jgi:hypothetical protein